MEIYKSQSGAAIFIDFEIASKTGSVSCRIALWDCLGGEGGVGERILIQ